MFFMFLIKLSSSFLGPIPKNYSSEASAVGSLRSSAPDLAALLIELAKPHLLSRQLAGQIDSVQIPINQDFSWGLGLGIQHSADGDALWQNGLTFGYKSFLSIYPKVGFGVVVLTNSDFGLTAAYDIAGRVLGGKVRWHSF